MKILITGICGFTGSILARAFQEFESGIELWGADNLLRPGSELNRARLKASGIHLLHADVRCRSDLEVVPAVHWVIDAAANPSVLSTSRVYSIAPLVNLPVAIEKEAYRPQLDSYNIVGLSSEGIAENFPTKPPISVYGATKLASELLALEYQEAFGLPIWINRCGVLAGAGQFGTPDQGIFTFWINSYLRRQPLNYIGFDGQGHQVRDCLHPWDLGELIWKQMKSPDRQVERVQNVGGGVASAMSLAQLSSWCAKRLGKHTVGHDSASRPYDVPWMVLDPTRAERQWDWQPTLRIAQILEEIAQHAEAHAEWLEISGCI
jgi:CDP-paratose 2-epimerase